MGIPFESVSQFQDAGVFWTVFILLVCMIVYLAPSVKKWLNAKVDDSCRISQIIDNNTAALNNSTEALRNNTEALRDIREEDSTCKAILIEHDNKSEIRFDNQNKQMDRLENKIERKVS